MTRQREQDIITLCADWCEREEGAVIKAAIEIWESKCYNVRPELSHRKLLSTKHAGGCAPRSGKPTMTEFGKARRKELTLVVQKASSRIVSKRKLHELTAHAWTPSMQAEENHMKRKRAARLVEITAAGADPDPGLLAGYSRAEIESLYTADQARLGQLRMQKHERKKLAFKPRVVHALHGKSMKI